MNEVGKRYSCRVEEGLLLPVLFVGKQSEGHGYNDQTYNICNNQAMLETHRIISPGVKLKLP